MAIADKDSSKVLLSLNWDDDAPEIRFSTNNLTGWDIESAINLQLDYQIPDSTNRICLGHVAMSRGGSTFKICPGKPQKGRKCSKCLAADGHYAANLHHAHTKDISDLPEEFRAHMQQPNFLYLASFGDGSLKVGTTTSHRKDRRLKEQGALWAVIVAKTVDGFAVRVLEDLVTKELSIGQAISTKKKIAGILNPIDQLKAQESLKSAFSEVEKLLTKTKSIEYELLGSEWENDRYESGLWNDVHLYPRSLSAGAHSLQILDVIGRICAISPKNSSDVFIADLDPLFGVVLETGHFPTEELLVQDALF